jgi:hypothetical protein
VLVAAVEHLVDRPELRRALARSARSAPWPGAAGRRSRASSSSTCGIWSRAALHQPRSRSGRHEPLRRLHPRRGARLRGRMPRLGR